MVVSGHSLIAILVNQNLVIIRNDLVIKVNKTFAKRTGIRKKLGEEFESVNHAATLLLLDLLTLLLCFYQHDLRGVLQLFPIIHKLFLLQHVNRLVRSLREKQIQRKQKLTLFEFKTCHADLRVGSEQLDHPGKEFFYFGHLIH